MAERRVPSRPARTSGAVDELIESMLPESPAVYMGSLLANLPELISTRPQRCTPGTGLTCTTHRVFGFTLAADEQGPDLGSE